jgi:hypothetical protein
LALLRFGVGFLASEGVANQDESQPNESQPSAAAGDCFADIFCRCDPLEELRLNPDKSEDRFSVPFDPPEIDGDAFVDGDAFIGGGVGTFLVGDRALICSRDRSGFGRLFLWPINKQTQDQQR